MRHASTLVQRAAVAMMATVVSAFPVAAQQMATNTAAGSRAEEGFAACDQIKDPAKSAQCAHDTTVQYFKDRAAAEKARGAAARQQSVEAREEGFCADQLAALRGKDPSIVQRGKLILAGRPLREFGICKLVSELTRG